MVAPSTIQATFNSGEWAPALYSRVDLAKWRTGCALAENFFIDYRGGASSRPGTKYSLQAFKSATAVRLIPFQASQSVGYALEFGDNYIRFHVDGGAVLETGLAISGATQANPCVLTIVGNTYSIGEWIYVASVVGMTQLNGRYYIITNVAGNAVTIADLFGTAVNSSAYTAYSSGGIAQRVYTLPSPYNSDDLPLLKFTQSVDTLIICHPSYEPYTLTLNTATSWTLTAIAIGSTVDGPATVTVTTTLSAGGANYSYGVTAVDGNGQESEMVIDALDARQSIITTAGTNRITWSSVPGAESYNVYKAEISSIAVVAAGVPYGFIGNATGISMDDSNIAPDYSQTPPISKNPFVGGNVLYAEVTTAGTYTTVPTVTFTGTADVAATGSAVLGVVGTPTTPGPGGSNGYAVGDACYFAYGVTLIVATVDGSGGVSSWQPITYPGSNPGSITSGSTPSNPRTSYGNSGSGNNGARATLTWGVVSVTITNAGIGYAAAPTIAFSSGSAAATATVSDLNVGYPLVPAFCQQRLWFLGKSSAPQSFEASQPGSFYNFDIYNPITADAAISGQLVSGQLNTIRAAVPVSAGLVVLSDRQSWLINGTGGAGSPISPIEIVANPQVYNGISDVPPIVAGGDILYVQAKGSIVRNLDYNFYTNKYTGTDISVISSHLFYGYTVLEWAWSEEPFKLVWAVRDDGALLTLTFLKEQEFIAWTHSVTDGDFKSVCSIVEGTDYADVDAVYFVVERTVNGQTLKYVERLADRIYPNGVEDAWCVDSGLDYDGASATTFTGFQHLTGESIVGLADGVPFTATVSATGSFTLATAATRVIAGLPFTCKLQTLPLDLGEPTVQGKVKKIPAVDVRVNETLGLKIGQDFDHLVVMKDLVDGNVSSMRTGMNLPLQVVDGLYSGDARTILGPAYTVLGQYCIQQDLPYPASILGVIPQIVVGDTKDSRQ